MDEDIKAKYAALNEAKAKAKAEKKAQKKGLNENLPVVKMYIPWETDGGREIDLEKPPWESYPEALENGWRESQRRADNQALADGPVRRRIIRT